MDSKDDLCIINVIIAICKQQVIWYASGVDQQTLQEVHHTLLKKEYKLHIMYYFEVWFEKNNTNIYIFM